MTRQSLERRRDSILEVARRHGASELRVFGSVPRGDATDDSDVDLLVRFESGRTLFDHAALIGELEDLLGVQVDVLDEDGMPPRFGSIVRGESIAL